MVWVLYERSALGIRHGWVAIPLSIIPGVAPGLRNLSCHPVQTAQRPRLNKNPARSL
jgi:hypothetical protein